MNILKSKYLKIGIDARFYGPVGKGLGRYTKEVIDNILKIDNENEYVVFLGKANFDDFPNNNLKVRKVLADVRWYTFAEQFVMPYLIWKEKIDLMHFPHFNVPILCPAKFIVTIHDLILTRYPTHRASTLNPIIYKIKNLGYKIIIWFAVKRSKKIIAVSDFTKEDIARQFAVDKNKIIVTYEGVAENLLIADNIDSREILKKYNITNPYLLYVGNAYPHKNLETLINIFVSIKNKQENLSLILVGKEDYFYERVKDYAKNLKAKNIVFPGFIPDEDLAVIYKEALTYVFPSLYEGFGLPPLEAMAHGCPVVSSNAASMPEILGDAALYFNPENKDEMKEKIIKIMSDEKLRENFINLGYKQAVKYNWLECSKKTLEIYRNY